MRKSSLPQKVLYAIFVIAILPVALVGWVQLTGHAVSLAVPNAGLLGPILSLLGVALLALGIINVFLTPDELPINNLPVVRFYTERVFYWIPFPVLTGFALALVGLSIQFNSPSGFWLASPMVALTFTASVYGRMRAAIARKYGVPSRKRFVRFAADEPAAPALAERLSVYIFVLVPWMTVYGTVAAIGVVPDAIDNFFPFEKSWPVIEWTAIFYFFAYLYVPLVPFIARQSNHLRQFTRAGIRAIVIIGLFFIIIPFTAPPRPFVPETLVGEILLWERGYDTAMCAFPSFHALWALLASWLYAKSFPQLRWLWWFLGIMICVSCVTAGMHSLIDIVGGGLLVPLVLQGDKLWTWIRSRMQTASVLRVPSASTVLPLLGMAGCCVWVWLQGGFVSLTGVAAIVAPILFAIHRAGTSAYALGYLVIPVFLLRLWVAGAALTLIGGLSLMLTALGAIVDGADQPPSLASTRSAVRFPWSAMGCFTGGAVLTTIDIPAGSEGGEHAWTVIATALGLGFIPFVVSVFAGPVATTKS